MSRFTPVGRPVRAIAVAGAVALLLLSFLAACGPSEEERATAARAEAWAELEAAQAALQTRRAELEQLREQAAAPAEGEDAEALSVQADALEGEVVNDAEAFGQKLVNYINEAIEAGSWGSDAEMSEEQRAAFAMKSSEDMYVAEEYVVKGGDYRRAIEILQRAQMTDPDNPDLAARLARYEADRYVTAERFADVKPGMTEAEVEAVLGKVFHSYVREFSDQNVFAWFYPKDPEQHGRSAAVGVFFRENDRKVYRTEFNAVEGQDEEE